MYTLHLFSGAGGGLLADILLGHTPVCAVELEEYPRRVLLQRQLDGVLPVFPVWDDVTSFSIDNPETAGMFDQLRKVSGELAICGGFPQSCQDISSAGKGAGITGSRSGLWSHMARIISEVRPRHVFVENSPMLVSRGLDVVLSDLAALGYDARWGIVGAHHAGAHHKRERIWIVADTNGCSRKITPRRSIERMGREQQSIPWNEPAECALSRLRGVDDGMAGVVDRTDAIRNGQVPAVAALAWEVLAHEKLDRR